jgi:hypothetical protein
MTKSPMDRKYDSLMLEATTAGGIRRAMKNLRSDQPEAIRAGRHDLTEIVNGYLGHKLIRKQYSDSVAIQYGSQLAADVVDKKAAKVLRSDPEGLVSEFKDREDKRAEKKYDQAVEGNEAHDKEGRPLTKDDYNRMARGYLGIAPIKTGNALFDAVAESHAQYREISDAIDAFNGKGENTLSRTDFVSLVAQYVGRDVQARLKNTGVDDLFDKTKKAGRDDKDDYDDAIKELVGEVMEDTVEGSVEMAVRLGSGIAKGLKKKIDGMLPKDQRADYVEANFKARASYADHLFENGDKHGAVRVYASIARDMSEIVK